jgi:hypothetical protein
VTTVKDERSYRFTSHWRRHVRPLVLRRQGYRCLLCPYAGWDGRGKGLHLAHLIPWPAGPDDETNTVALCATCHRRFDAGRKIKSDVFADAFVAAGRLGLTVSTGHTPGRVFADRSRTALSHGRARTDADPVKNGIPARSVGVGPGSPALGFNYFEPAAGESDQIGYGAS